MKEKKAVSSNKRTNEKKEEEKRGEKKKAVSSKKRRRKTKRKISTWTRCHKDATSTSVWRYHTTRTPIHRLPQAMLPLGLNHTPLYKRRVRTFMYVSIKIHV